MFTNYIHMSTSGFITQKSLPRITALGYILTDPDGREIERKVLQTANHIVLIDEILALFEGRMMDTWVHWNMTSYSYGFYLITKYASLLNNIIWYPPVNNISLSRLLNKKMYDYVVENNLYTRDFKTGKEELALEDDKPILTRSVFCKLDIIQHAYLNHILNNAIT